MSREVVITGLGFVTSIGRGREEVTTSLRELRHGITRWEPLGPGKHPVSVAGVVKGDTSEMSIARHRPPHLDYALDALNQAVAEAGLKGDLLTNGRCGLYCASGGSAIILHKSLTKLESTDYKRGHPLSVLNSIAGTLNFHLATHLGIRGAGCGFVTACASGSHALGFAYDEIMMGRQDRMIVVAAEDLTAETILSFHAMGALSTNAGPDTASRPFDSARDGFVGSGGAVAIVLEEVESARERGVRPQAVMQGWGQASDGHHPAQPHPEGAGIADAMRNALRSTGVATEDVGYINAHATSTPTGDKAEAQAIHAVMGDSKPPVSSTKALTGHGLSLAGGMEAAFCVLSLDEGFIPGQAHLKNPDDVSLCLNLPLTSLPDNPHIVLNNSSGFGGANVCHVFSSVK